MRMALLLVAALTLSGAALAQEDMDDGGDDGQGAAPEQQDSRGGPAEQQDPRAGPAGRQGERGGRAGRGGGGNPAALACRKSGQDRQLRGPDLRDHIQICILEARLACTREAIGKKIQGPQRREFIQECVSRGG